MHETKEGKIDLYITGLGEGIEKNFEHLENYTRFKEHKRIYGSNSAVLFELLGK